MTRLVHAFFLIITAICDAAGRSFHTFRGLILGDSDLTVHSLPGGSRWLKNYGCFKMACLA